MPPSCALLGGFAIGARVALLWQHYGNAWQSTAVIHQAHRTPHACRTRMPAKTPLAGNIIDAPAACAVPFRPYCAGVVTRTLNVIEYMLVLVLCLVCAILLQLQHAQLTLSRDRWRDKISRDKIAAVTVLQRHGLHSVAAGGSWDPRRLTRAPTHHMQDPTRPLLLKCLTVAYFLTA